MSAKDAGQTFLEQLLAHVPADKQAAVREVLAVDGILTELGAATLRQSEFSRAMDANNTYKAQLDAWFTENSAKLTEYEAWKANPNPAPANPNPNPAAPATGLTKEQLEAELAAREQAAIAAIVHTNQLATKHLHTFNEPLDIAKLMADPEIGKLGLLGVYEKTYKPRYDEIAQKAETARIEAEVQKRLAAERAANPARLPYPTSGQEPSILDSITNQLKNPTDPSKPVTAPVHGDQVLEAAVADYTAALSNRFGVPQTA